MTAERTAVDFISPEDRADAGEVVTFGFVSLDRAERFAAKLRAEGIEVVSIRPQPDSEVLALLRKISPALFNKDSSHG
jgi:hypothetical protein